MKKTITLLLVVAGVWSLVMREDQTRYGPGVAVDELPVQEKILAPRTIRVKDYTITPLATFRIKAKVLSKATYHWGREAELSPVDLALGWGRMSDESVLEAIRIRQSNRWYRWRTDEFPIPRREIETHSGNMHMIPADRAVEVMLKRVRRGDIVELQGKLVRVDAEDGWRWVSSLSRKDTGSGSCEVFWVESLEEHFL
jgi:hypothetical protein